MWMDIDSAGAPHLGDLELAGDVGQLAQVAGGRPLHCSPHHLCCPSRQSRLLTATVFSTGLDAMVTLHEDSLRPSCSTAEQQQSNHKAFFRGALQGC